MAAALTLAMGCTPTPHALPESECALPSTGGLVDAPSRTPLVIGTLEAQSELESRDLFRQVFQTLARLDCDERLVPDFAASWERTPVGALRVVLPRATFRDGTPIEAGALVQRWTQAGDLPLSVDSIRAIGDHLVDIFGADVAGRDLASPAFVVWSGDRAQPMGTGRFEVTDRADDGTPAELSDGQTFISILTSGENRRRDLLTRVHLLRAWDRGVLDLAAGMPALAVIRLGWSRFYGLTVPGGSGVAVLPGSLLRGLSDTVVPAESRPLRCSPTAERRAPSQAPATLDRNASDPVSRALAERLVALSTQESEASAALQAASGLSGLRLVGASSPESASVRRVMAHSACDGPDESASSELWIPLVEVHVSLVVDDLPVPAFVDADGFLVIGSTGSRPQR